MATNGKVKRTALADLSDVKGHWNTVMGGPGKGDHLALGLLKGAVLNPSTVLRMHLAKGLS